MKVFCGIYPHGSYEGEIIFSGETLQPSYSRYRTQRIAIIHQELALVKHLTVLENIFSARRSSRHGLLGLRNHDLYAARSQAGPSI